MKIIKTVGKNCANESTDVRVVQACLNAHVKFHNASLKPVVEDGRCGPKTIEAIGVFQKDYVGMIHPDFRIDPNGKTIRYLTMYINKDSPAISKSPTAIGASSLIIKGMDNIAVSYSNNIKPDRKLVSAYSISIVKMALKESGMNHAVITSTLRTPEDQATIMLQNAKVSLSEQKKLYAAAGRKVLDVYEKNKSKKDSEIITLMAEKIQALMDENISVSNHCFSLANYASKNVFDIGVNSTKSKSKNFNRTKFTDALNDLCSDGYISKVLDETAKSNNCWHLEIIPNSKQIQLFDKNSMLFPIKYINGMFA